MHFAQGTFRLPWIPTCEIPGDVMGRQQVWASQLDVLLLRAALQGCTEPQQEVQLMSPLLLFFCSVSLGPGWLQSQVSRSPQQKKVCAPQGLTQGMVEEHVRGLGEENLKLSTPNLQICAHGLTIPYPEAKANFPLLPAGKACPLWGEQHGASTASRAQMWASGNRGPKAARKSWPGTGWQWNG